MATLSAGLLLYRFGTGSQACNDGPSGRDRVGEARRGAADAEVLLVHPGGPFWRRKDDGAWSIPKGEHDPPDDPHDVAVREFTEELGSPPPPAPADAADIDLAEVRLASGKRVHAFARQGSFDATTCASNTFEQEWPPKSGRLVSFPEVDRAEWFSLGDARRKLNVAQAAFVDRLATQLGGHASSPGGATGPVDEPGT